MIDNYDIDLTNFIDYNWEDCIIDSNELNNFITFINNQSIEDNSISAVYKTFGPTPEDSFDKYAKNLQSLLKVELYHLSNKFNFDQNFIVLYNRQLYAYSNKTSIPYSYYTKGTIGSHTIQYSGTSTSISTTPLTYCSPISNNSVTYTPLYYGGNTTSSNSTYSPLPIKFENNNTQYYYSALFLTNTNLDQFLKFKERFLKLRLFK